jgi:hypothetical protein
MDINGGTPAGSISNQRFQRTGVAGTMERSYDSFPANRYGTSAGLGQSNESVPRHSTGYCQACFKATGRVFLDGEGRCPTHGGKAGQTLGLTKVDKAMLGIGAGIAAACLLTAFWGPGESGR